MNERDEYTGTIKDCLLRHGFSEIRRKDIDDIERLQQRMDREHELMRKTEDDIEKTMSSLKVIIATMDIDFDDVKILFKSLDNYSRVEVAARYPENEVVLEFYECPEEMMFRPYTASNVQYAIDNLNPGIVSETVTIPEQQEEKKEFRDINTFCKWVADKEDEYKTKLSYFIKSVIRDEVPERYLAIRSVKPKDIRSGYAGCRYTFAINRYNDLLWKGGIMEVPANTTVYMNKGPVMALICQGDK